MISIVLLLKCLVFGLPYAIYKATGHDSLNFKEFVKDHTEEVSGGAFAGMTGIIDFVLISKAEAHDIYIGCIKAVIMSAVGYLAAYLGKRILQWIQRSLK